MSDLYELLEAEAQRQRPTRQPGIAELVNRHRARRRRRLAVAAVVISLGGATLLLTPGIGGDPSDSRHVPVSSGPTDTASLVIVSGTLVAVGGPPSATPDALSGQVVFTAADGSQWTARAADGRFTVAVPPGSYTVIGFSPSYGDGQGKCFPVGPPNMPVTVSSATKLDVEVVCHLK